MTKLWSSNGGQVQCAGPAEKHTFYQMINYTRGSWDIPSATFVNESESNFDMIHVMFLVGVEEAT